MRELRQHASRYLERVAAGEDFEVTDRGRPVALLVPVPTDDWQRLLATGRVDAPATDDGLLAEDPADFGVDASAALAAQREQER